MMDDFHKQQGHVFYDHIRIVNSGLASYLIYNTQSLTFRCFENQPPAFAGSTSYFHASLPNIKS
jgi:hypothetical protein